MQKITPFLWFESRAEEAVDFYTALFKHSKVGRVARYGEAGKEAHGRKPGTVMTMEFELAGYQFVALNGGPVFKFTPAVSFFVHCETKQEIDRLWKGLSAGGEVLMELDKYDWSEKYGWLNDRYGVSWQLAFDGQHQGISPSLMFVGEQAGKAEEAIKLYTSLFENSEIENVLRYPQESEQANSVQHAVFRLAGQEFMAMDSAIAHQFTITGAVSFVVNCETQAEVDRFWYGLSADPSAEQCGWLKDKYGVSWQIVPIVLPKMLQDKDPAKAERVMEAMLQMKKLDIKTLQQAYDGQ